MKLRTEKFFYSVKYSTFNHKQNRTTKLIQSTLVSGAIALLFSFSVAAGNANTHTSEAIKHAQTAANSGKNGNAKQLLSHAEESLKHVTAALPELSDGTQRMHITESIRHLDQAIAHAKEDHAEEATQHVDQAIAHLKYAAR